MDRKIIQICCATSESSGSLGKERLYALADDGTIWFFTPPGSEAQKWKKLPSLPEDKKEKLVSI